MTPKVREIGGAAAVTAGTAVLLVLISPGFAEYAEVDEITLRRGLEVHSTSLADVTSALPVTLTLYLLGCALVLGGLAALIFSAVLRYRSSRGLGVVGHEVLATGASMR